MSNHNDQRNQIITTQDSFVGRCVEAVTERYRNADPEDVREFLRGNGISDRDGNADFQACFEGLPVGDGEIDLVVSYDAEREALDVRVKLGVYLVDPDYVLARYEETEDAEMLTPERVDEDVVILDHSTGRECSADAVVEAIEDVFDVLRHGEGFGRYFAPRIVGAGTYGYGTYGYCEEDEPSDRQKDRRW